MILIPSAAYTSPSLISEFGKLPPCMLPVQNRRLYVHQLRLFPHDEEVVISLPADYVVTDSDSLFFREHNVWVVHVPTLCSLGASVVYVLNVMGRYDEPLKVLHGDTLIDDLPAGYDVIAVAEAEDDYAWSYYDDARKQAYAGYFAFSSQSLLIKSITECNSDFIDGVRRYSQTCTLCPCMVNRWLDFGISNSYYRSKSKMTTQRVFNDLDISRYSVTKRSRDARKILAEAHWFANLPKPLRQYAPCLWDEGIDSEGRGFYEIEYYYLSSLADLFVFGNNPSFIWKHILDSCVEFINAEALIKPTDSVAVAQQNTALYKAKTQERLYAFCQANAVDVNAGWFINGEPTPSLLIILDEMGSGLSEANEAFVGVMHGDPCFSNILYDFVSRSIKVLDPRGLDAKGNESIYGDIRYDVAKLAHSIVGMYDYIIGGKYTLTRQGNSFTLEFSTSDTIKEVQTYFRTLSFGGFGIEQLQTYPIMVLLFLSMLPLHSDCPERQIAMLANALRLYVEYKKHHQK